MPHVLPAPSPGTRLAKETMPAPPPTTSSLPGYQYSAVEHLACAQDPHQSTMSLPDIAQHPRWDADPWLQPSYPTDFQIPRQDANPAAEAHQTGADMHLVPAAPVTVRLIRGSRFGQG